MSKGIRQKPLFTSPEAVSQAFYEAIEAGDIEAMMAVWADDEEVVCVHPGGPRLTGFDAVRTSWEQILSARQRMHIQLESPIVVETVGMAMQTAFEVISVDDEPAPRGVVVVTNVFLRTPTGWRMVMHHGSAMPSSATDADPPSRQLH